MSYTELKTALDRFVGAGVYMPRVCHTLPLLDKLTYMDPPPVSRDG